MSNDLPLKFSEFSEARKNGFIKVMELKEKGKKVAGVFCAFTPLEILDAAGFVTVGLCGMSAETIPDAEAHLPKNLCPLIKSSYGFYVSDKCPYTFFSDLIVGETTCDGKKKMYELLGKGKKTFILHLPQGEADFALDEWTAEIRRFINYLNKEFNLNITDEAIRKAAIDRNEERVEKQKLMEIQKNNPPLSNGADLYKAMDGVGFLFSKNERISKLRSLRESIEKEQDLNTNKGKKRILITGCPIGGVLTKTIGTIEQCGGVVVCFENCSGLKSCMDKVDTEAYDIVKAIAKRYLNIGCAVMTPNSARIKNLEKFVKEYSVDGVVDISLHTCTPYNVESYTIQQEIKKLGIPFLALECDYTSGDEEQLKTRIGAFLEILN